MEQAAETLGGQLLALCEPALPHGLRYTWPGGRVRLAGGVARSRRLRAGVQPAEEDQYRLHAVHCHTPRHEMPETGGSQFQHLLPWLSETAARKPLASAMGMKRCAPPTA